MGRVETSDAAMRRAIQQIAAKFEHVHFCYEAGPTRYGLYRLIPLTGSRMHRRRSIVDPEEAT
ncbi:hypothetical protein GGD56_006862 [Rhizobium mongolense]|uniref:Transposase n=1 Tax=Rhizobium mongolense TaxID=57676 RepID=A0ABR6IYG6_9HYPH|nr:hypothetical protein [Rhizobium mongolense]